jgi:hypothetical protein
MRAVVLGLVGAVLAGSAWAGAPCKGKVALVPEHAFDGGTAEPLVLDRVYQAPIPGFKGGQYLAFTATRAGKRYTLLLEMPPSSSSTYVIREGRAALADLKMRRASQDEMLPSGTFVQTYGDTLAMDWTASCL